jgi:outer membrane lipoprotein carrier protein
MVYRILILVIVFVSSLSASINLDNLKSFKASFTQTIMNETNKTIVYKGDVFIKNSGKVLWKYKTPIIKNVYVINNVAIIDEPELEQAIYTTLENSIDMLKLLKEAKKINENIYQTNLYNRNYMITMKEDKIYSLSYVDELENKILIVFNEAEQNIEIEDDLFQFLPPDYYDIIKK